MRSNRIKIVNVLTPLAHEWMKGERKRQGMKPIEFIIMLQKC